MALVLYEANTGFPRISPPSQQILYGRTTPAVVASKSLFLYQPSKPTRLELEADQAVRRGPDLNRYRVGYQTVGQRWNAFKWTTPPTVESEPYSVYRSPTNYFSFIPAASVNGTSAILAYQSNVLYEANTGFPRIPPPSQQILYGRTTPAAVTPQPFYAYKWTTPPTVTAEADAAVRLRSDLNLYRVGYQTVGQPWNVFQWYKAPTVEQEQYAPYRSPADFFSFIQPGPVNGTLAYLAYQTNVLYEDRSGFPRTQATNYTVMMFGRTTPVTPNVYPWYVYAWQRTRPQDAEAYEVRPTRPDALWFWRNTYTPPVANPWSYGQLHWQQAVTVEPEQYRVSTPFPYPAFFWRSPTVTPPYPGQTIWDATYQVVNDNMMVYPIEWVMSSTVPFGYVISRTPFPDSAQPNWTYIKMVASAGPPAALGYSTVPNVTALRTYDASSLLATLGLTPGTVTYANSGTVAAGIVLSQSVTAGITVAEGTTVNYTVSLGAVSTTVYTTTPTLTGSTLATAVAATVQANLIVLPPVYQASATVPAGTVISQSPVAGTQQSLWTAVSLVISSGVPGTPTYATVPNIVGTAAATGNALLTGVGLVPTNVTYSYQTSVAAGVIVSQGVAAGTVVLAGITVAYVVSLGPQVLPSTVAIPNVVGLTLDAARSALVNANLIVTSPVYAASATVYAGTVISQSPAAGTVVSYWATVSLIVSSG